MDISNNIRVNKFLNDIQSVFPERIDIILAIREQFFQAESNIEEDIKYGGLVFNVSNTLIGGLFSYTKHLSIEFSNGADFSDKGNVLEGGGKRRRHLKIFQLEDIKEKDTRYYIAQAVKI